MLKLGTEQKVKPKPRINIGALFDIPTATIVTGAKGESILNGGLGQITAIIGVGNSFKSTILHYMTLSAADKINSTNRTGISTYDTEINIELDRLESFSSRFDNLDTETLIRSENPLWQVTNKQIIPGNKWGLLVNEYSDEKAKDKTNRVKFTAFMDPYTKKTLELPVPTFIEIDSLSEFDAESTAEMLNKDLDSSETNTYAMRKGLFKTKFIQTLPVMAGNSNTYFLMTAHKGSTVNMNSNPYAPQPTKKLQYLKGDDAIKGVGTGFTFLTNILWDAQGASALVNQGTKLPEYPSGENDKQKVDLNVVRLVPLRNKSGLSGYTVSIIVSQNEGVLPSLTEFHHIKENGRFGIDGNNVSYNLFLYPEVKLARTTVRTKLQEDARLRRAVNITSELLQLSLFHPEYHDMGLMCSPQELYEDIKKLGYDWNVLLDTRGYWVIDQYSHPIPFLSVVDLLKMRKEQYFPYFLNEDKTLKTNKTKDKK